MKYVKGSMAFPSGKLDGSGLLLEKIVPAEVMVGKSLTYEIRAVNISGQPLRDVRVWDQVSSNFKPSSATPQPASVESGQALWVLGDMPAGKTEVIKVTGTAGAEGTITSCGWATYTPVLCEPIKVTRASLQLVKTAPAEISICDPIEMVVTVRNNGSTVLNQVRITDALPPNMKTSDNQTAHTFDAGTLQPAQSKEFKFSVVAAKTGKYENKAKVTTAQGIEAEASATTTVRSPELALECAAPGEVFAGRPARVNLKVTNKGDAPETLVTVELPIPAGATVQSATEGGRTANNRVVWEIRNLAPNAAKDLSATLVASQPGSLAMNVTARGACAKPVEARCNTRVAGIPAILLEVIDIEDPIEVGNNEVYEIIVTNQGSAPDTGVKVVCTLEDSQEFVSGTGTTAVSGAGRTITMQPVASLAPKAKATWRVTVKALKAGDIRFSVKMTSDNIDRPVEETEATRQY